MELVDTCDDKVKNNLKVLLDDKEFESAADFVVESLGKGQFERNSRELFDDNKIKNIGISNSMRLLPQIFPNAVITTN